MFFHAKIGILGKNLYGSHTLFILYLDGNQTLFGEKLYFIWKFSSGNTEHFRNPVIRTPATSGHRRDMTTAVENDVKAKQTNKLFVPSLSLWF